MAGTDGRAKLAAADAYHKKVARKFNAGKSRKEFAAYSQGLAAAVFNALYREGGGLTAAELHAAAGKEASMDRGTFDKIVRRMKSGSTDAEYARALNAVEREMYYYKNGMQLVDYEKVKRMIPVYTAGLQAGGADPCLREDGGKLYLWCQVDDDGECRKDLFGAYENPMKTISDCEEAVEDGRKASADINALKAKIEEMTVERESLGFFKGRRGKELKSSIAEAQEALSVAYSRQKRAQECEKTLERIYSLIDGS